ncbi:MAG: lipid-A-disaccharide synthase [Acidobacteriota bacterium]
MRAPFRGFPLEGSILVVAGEASGDHQAAGLVRALRERFPRLDFFGMGGPELAAAGVEIVQDVRELAVMGLAEVCGSLYRGWTVLRRLREALRHRRPRAAILVDFPDFNLRLARTSHGLGIPVVYFISPQVWAWRPGRVQTLCRTVDQIICILPFEVAFYRRHGARAVYVGHPLVDQALRTPHRAQVRAAWGIDSSGPVLALLPGSRLQEVRAMLPAMVEAARRLARNPGLQAVLLPVAATLEREDLLAAAGGEEALQGIRIVPGGFFQVLGAADVAMVTSGTATLAAAVFDTPMVVGYRLHPFTYVVGRFLTQVSDIALVNLVAGRRVVPERIQDDCNPESLSREVRRLLVRSEARRAQQDSFQEVRSLLGPPGVFSRAAEATAAGLFKSRR